MTKEQLAERVFDRITRMGIQPHAVNFFMVALILWDEDRQKISKGFERKNGEEQEPARSTKHGIE